MLELSKRLQAVADMVTPGMRLADGGTDHGYIPIYLVEKRLIPSAIAMDINEGPLKRAEEHIQEYGLSDRIETRLSDGLKNLKREEADTMIAAGMGGGLVIRILSDSRNVAESMQEMILQPQSEISRVREYLLAQHYSIVEENIVLEDGKYYPMMKVVPQGNVETETYEEAELEFGRILLQKAHPVLRQFLEREIVINTQIRENLSVRDSDRAKERMGEIDRRIKKMEEILCRYFDA